LIKIFLNFMNPFLLPYYISAPVSWSIHTCSICIKIYFYVHLLHNYLHLISPKYSKICIDAEYDSILMILIIHIFFILIISKFMLRSIHIDQKKILHNTHSSLIIQLLMFDIAEVHILPYTSLACIEHIRGNCGVYLWQWIVDKLIIITQFGAIYSNHFICRWIQSTSQSQ
jgi:hypothetical protein